MIDTTVIKNYLGEKWFSFIMILVMGFSMAVALPFLVVTPEAFAQEKERINAKIDTNVASLRIDNANLELSILRKEKNELLDLIDAGKAKPRHLERLQEIKDRMKEIENNKKAWAKIMESK